MITRGKNKLAVKECNNEFFDYNLRVNYYCQLKEGHRGKHKHTSITVWSTCD